MNIRTLPPGSPWRTVLLVLVVAAADFLLSLVLLGMGLERGIVPADPGTAEFLRFATAPVLAPLGAVALIWRRRFPKSVAAAAAVLGALSFSGIAFFVALFLLAKRRLDWWVAAVIALSIGGEALAGAEPLGWDGVLVGVVLLVAIAVWGAYRGQRARLMDARLTSLKERAERAETERAADADRSRLAERHRIAREMHDTLAHRMSLVAVQAGALLVDAPDEETAAAAGLIRNTAHAALGELRDVLGVLHEDGTAGTVGAAGAAGWQVVAPGPAQTESPQAAPSQQDQLRQGPSGIGQIAGLVAEWRQAGVAVDYSPVPEMAEVLPDAVSRAAYRVMQEGITNVARHAPGAKATAAVELRCTGTAGKESDGTTAAGTESAGRELHVVVANGPGSGGEPLPGSGLGLVGLAERVRLLGGTLEHGPVPSQHPANPSQTGPGYRLFAAIPFTPRCSSGGPS